MCSNLDFDQQTADLLSNLRTHITIPIPPHHFTTLLARCYLVRPHIHDNITRRFILDTLLHNTDHFALQILVMPRTVRLLVFFGRPNLFAQLKI